jgi:hypothetical protein
MTGPALVVVLAPYLMAQGVFAIALGLIGVITVLAGLALRVPGSTRRAQLTKRPTVP